MKAHYCLFCGTPYSEETLSSYEEHHRLDCQSCSRTWYNNPKPVVLAYILDDEGRILLGKRGIEPLKGSWGMPGGFIEYGEEPAEAIRREIREELSVNGEVSEVLDSFHEFYDNLGDPTQRSSTTGIVFRCHLPETTLKAADDVAALAWYPPTEIEHLIRFEGQKRFLLKRVSGGRFV